MMCIKYTKLQKNQWQTYGDMGPETYQFYEDIHA